MRNVAPHASRLARRTSASENSARPRPRTREHWSAALRFSLALILCLAVTASAEPLIRGVDSVGITVDDLDRSVAFYSDVLGFAPAGEIEVTGEAFERLAGVFGVRARIARLRLGDESIELTEYLAPEGRPMPLDSRSHDRWFQHVAIIVSDMDRAYAWLRQNKVRHASSGPQTLPASNPNAGGIRAFYFKDPDGHVLEILELPPGKGAEKWHVEGNGLFLGIDHTAIVVDDTEASLRFYRDELGLAVAGESHNDGPEQEHLNNVEGARLRITALRSAAGPGIELLEYLSPSDGRPYPADLRANDLAHWLTRLRTSDIDAAAKELGGYSFVSRSTAGRESSPSTGTVDVTSAGLGFSTGLVVRDPDGHAMQVVQP